MGRKHCMHASVPFLALFLRWEREKADAGRSFCFSARHSARRRGTGLTRQDPDRAAAPPLRAPHQGAQARGEHAEETLHSRHSRHPKRPQGGLLVATRTTIAAEAAQSRPPSRLRLAPPGFSLPPPRWDSPCRKPRFVTPFHSFVLGARGQGGAAQLRGDSRRAQCDVWEV